MIVSIVDHGGARRRTKATAATVEVLLSTSTIVMPVRSAAIPPTRRVAERSPSRATIALTTVYTAEATENRRPISPGRHAVRLELQRDEQIDAAADEADQRR